jgi:hypothetical protein
MSFVGHGWRSGQASDTATGSNSTATVGSLSPTTAARRSTINLTVTGTGFAAGAVVYIGYSPCNTVFVNATTLRVDNFYVMTDSGNAGTLPVGVRKSGEKLSNTVNLTVT